MTRLISNVNEKCAHCSFAASITYSVFGLRWLIIPACLSTFIAHQIILSKYVLPLPHEAQTPMLLKLLLWWRNLSLFLVLLSSVASPVRRSDWPRVVSGSACCTGRRIKQGFEAGETGLILKTGKLRIRW